MSYVEIETGRYVKRWAFWNPATWSIPKLYWDAWSQEQRLHAICRQLEKVIKYADYLGVNVDDIAARLKAIEEGQLDPVIEAAIETWFEENEPEIMNRLDAIEADNWVTENRIADDAVTNGKIKDDAVTTDKIADDAVTTVKIVDEAVTTAKIADEAVTFDKLDKSVIYELTDNASITPVCYGTFSQTDVKGNYGHIGAICDIGTNQIVISNKLNSSGNEYTDDGTAHVVSIENDSIVSERTLNIGHANSIATDKSDVIIAPQSYFSGNYVYLQVYDVGLNYKGYISQPFAEGIWGVSYDPVSGKWYAAAARNLFEFTYDAITFEGTFTLVDNIDVPISEGSNWANDIAVYDNTVFIATTRGTLLSFEIGESSVKTWNVNHTDASGNFVLGEFDGIEFNSDGIMLTCFDTTYGTALVDNCFICSLPVNNRYNKYALYGIYDRFTSNTLNVIYIEPTLSALRGNLSTYDNFEIVRNFNNAIGENRFFINHDITVTNLIFSNGNNVIIESNGAAITVTGIITFYNSLTFVNTILNLSASFNPQGCRMITLCLVGSCAVNGNITSWFNNGQWGSQFMITGWASSRYPTIPLWPGSSIIPNTSGKLYVIAHSIQTIN